jgi:hypothetical protein
MTQNTKNDMEKHVEAFEGHLAALYGDGWEQLTAKEICKLLSHHTLGLNGGTAEMMPEAAERVGFERHNVVPIGQGTYQVLTMIEFHESADGQVLH